MRILHNLRRTLVIALLLHGATGLCFAASTAGSARMNVTLLDYTGTSGTKHYTVVWVTTSSGTFIKTLRKQGPSNWGSSEWNSHCRVWNDARAGSTVIDGYSSATASNYTGTNSPVILTWNGKDAAGNLMPDGQYKFWVQYAENSGQGPYTTSGLLWTKGPSSASVNYPNQGANFAGMSVVWTPEAPPVLAPTITSAPPAGTGIVGVPYNFSCTATGTAPITFSATGLPVGVEMSPAGLISGIPTTVGTFNGAITAANGTPPNATQLFSIVVDAVPVDIDLVQSDGASLVLGGSGPPNGTYRVLVSTNPAVAPAEWRAIATNVIDASGQFRHTNSIDPGTPMQFQLLRVP